MGHTVTSNETLHELLTMLEQLERRKQIYKLEYYDPYPYQVRFHHAIGHLTPGKLAIFRALCAANGIGKTRAGCMEDAMHLTGRYPDWWQGHRFHEPVSLLACGLTNESTRDVLQKELFGDPTDPKTLGTGTIPIDLIGKINRKTGVTNAFDGVKVRHEPTGRWSTCYFRAYEQGWQKLMGTRFEVFHADEEPPEEIWSQLVRSGISKKKVIGILTWTPELGLTAVTDQFANHPAEGQAFINATWADAPHLMKDGKYTDEARVLAANIPKHQLKMRTEGQILAGAGLVYNVPDDLIRVTPFQIPAHWPQIVGIDFGVDHPFAAARLAWDRDNDCIYLVSEYRDEHRQVPAVHVQSINAWGGWQPVAWPHDGLKTELNGKDVIGQYRSAGLKALANKATFAPDVGKEEGTGGNSVEAGLLDISTRMETGRFKVFENCTTFFEEKRTYHRKNGQIVKLREDLMDAVRYGVMMIRHATVNRAPVLARTAQARDGSTYLSARPSRRR